MKKKTMWWRSLWLPVALLWLGGPGWNAGAEARESGFMSGSDAVSGVAEWQRPQAKVSAENAVCDTLRMTWNAEAGDEKAFSFEGSRGGRYVLHWGDGDTTPVVATGELERVAHVYARGGSYKVVLCGSPRGGEPSGEDYVETAFGMELSMVYVSGGAFAMGATVEQGEDAYDDEKPEHGVTLSDFYIGKYEVTQAQWEAVMGTNPCESSYGLGNDYPVYNVSWEEANEFCAKLSALTGKTYRLPTEAEWEYAARGGQQADGTKYAGSDDIDAVAWYGGNSGFEPHPVGRKRPNGLGLYDMSGNVWEWCSDWNDADYYSVSPSVNPQGPSSGSGRVARGGSWNYDARQCRVSFRLGGAPGYRIINLGFRVVCER